MLFRSVGLVTRRWACDKCCYCSWRSYGWALVQVTFERYGISDIEYTDLNNIVDDLRDGNEVTDKRGVGWDRHNRRTQFTLRSAGCLGGCMGQTDERIWELAKSECAYNTVGKRETMTYRREKIDRPTFGRGVVMCGRCCVWLMAPDTGLRNVAQD